MFKIGISSAPRIVPAEVTNIEESPVQQKLEQQSTPEPQIALANTSIRAESMFSAVSMRAQLMQRLARNGSSETNSDSLKQLKPIDQPSLSQSDAQQQISDQSTYVKPFSADDIEKGEALGKTLNTGDGNDQVEIKWGDDSLVHVIVNGKDAWSGTHDQFKSLTVNTGGGKDIVTNYVGGAKIETGEGNDRVTSYGDHSQIDTGDGMDVVALDGDFNSVNTGDGNDAVIVSDGRRSNDIRTGIGEDSVNIGAHAFSNKVSTEDGDDVIRLDEGSSGNRVDSGDGDDTVEDHGLFNRVDGRRFFE